VPGADVEVQPGCLQSASGSLPSGITEQIAELPVAAGQFAGEPNVTLASMPRVIHREHEAFSPGIFPRKSDKSVAGPIAFPSGRALEQLPAPVPEDGPSLPRGCVPYLPCPVNALLGAEVLRLSALLALPAILGAAAGVALFNRIDADVYCLEYDSARAGDFSPLRHVPRGKRVILGLVSTKTPVLESKDFLKRQIDAASRHAGLEQLGIGPQCGFSSGGGSGQPITQDDTRRKLELIMEVSQEIWSNA